MNSLTFNAADSSTTRASAPDVRTAICTTPVEPVLMTRSGTGTTRTTQHVGRRMVPTRIAAAMRILARWLPMSVSSTPSAQAISELSQRDRLGERN